MKKLALAVCLAGISSLAIAQGQSVDRSGWYASGGLAKVSGSDEAPEPTNYILSVGFNFTNSFGVEVQYSDSISDDSVNLDYSITESVDGVGIVDYYFDNSDVSLNTAAIFGTYTFGGNLYGKVKAGFMKAEYVSEVNFDFDIRSGQFAGETGSSSVEIEESESGWAAGIGGGYQFNANSAIELEYLTTADKIDVDFIALSYKYSF